MLLSVYNHACLHGSMHSPTILQFLLLHWTIHPSCALSVHHSTMSADDHGVLLSHQLAAGVFGNSTALVADALHSLGDTVSDFVTLYFLSVSRAPPDKDHPYGHRKFESIGALGVSAFLITTGLGFAYHAVPCLLDAVEALQATPGDVITPSWIACAAAVTSIGAKEWLYRLDIIMGVL